MPDRRPLKHYSEADHAERVRAVIRKRIEAMPLKALVKLQEVAALLEAGESLKVALAREKLGKRRGHVQVQMREDVDRGQRTSFDQATEDLAAQEVERAAIGAAVAARQRRWRSAFRQDSPKT